MTQLDILFTAVTQSALELGCFPQQLISGEKAVVDAVTHPAARAYLTLPFDCNIVSYGGGAVASCAPRARAAVTEYLQAYPAEHLFETPNLHVLDEKLAPLGLQTCFMAEYFLPELSALKPLDCPYEMRLMTDFSGLYLPQWGNALCEKRAHLDVLGMGAYAGDRLIGLAACSADCDTMWQIGIDVLPACRRQGVAAALTARLALEILKRDKVPFYCAAWSNIPSVRNAIRAGFRPAWVELTAKPKAFVKEMRG